MECYPENVSFLKGLASSEGLHQNISNPEEKFLKYPRGLKSMGNDGSLS